jgi:membrane associated rhomboid family serine protease
MANVTFPGTDPLTAILRLCAGTAPKPWYPRIYCQETGIARDSLDLTLERLRLGGMIHLTDWVEGTGQGYSLTPAGRRALESPRDLDRLRGDKPLIPNGAPRPEARPREGEPTTYERGELIREALVGSFTPFVTYTLLVANIAWFLYGMRLAVAQGITVGDFASDSDIGILRRIGAIQGSYLVTGDWQQWGRLLASCFVHGNILHLGMNMLGLFMIGPLVERLWGHARFLTIYLIAGLGGSCVMVMTNPAVTGVGASGALWGVMTSLAGWIILNRKFLAPEAVSSWLRRLLFLFVLNLGIGFVPGVSMSAHLGGGAIGAIAAVLLHYHRFGKGVWRWAALAGTAALPLVCVATLAEARTVDKRWEPLWSFQQEVQKKQVNKQFETRFVEPSKIALTKARDAVNQALDADLLNGRATIRDAKKVVATETLLDEARTGLLSLANDLSDISYQELQVEERRKVLEQLLRKRADFCELTKTYLNEKREFKPGTQEVDDWEELQKACNDLKDRFINLP